MRRIAKGKRIYVKVSLIFSSFSTLKTQKISETNTLSNKKENSIIPLHIYQQSQSTRTSALVPITHPTSFFSLGRNTAYTDDTNQVPGSYDELRHTHTGKPKNQ